MKKAIAVFVAAALIAGGVGAASVSSTEDSTRERIVEPEPIPLDCQGCCSGHGGVVCDKGETRCKDGTPLSPKCRSKGCDKC